MPAASCDVVRPEGGNMPVQAPFRTPVASADFPRLRASNLAIPTMNQRLWGPASLWWMTPALPAGAPPGVLAAGLTLVCILRYGPEARW